MNRRLCLIFIFVAAISASCGEKPAVVETIDVQHDLLPDDTVRAKLSKTGKICGATASSEFIIVNDIIAFESVSLPPEWEVMKIQHCE